MRWLISLLVVAALAVALALAGRYDPGYVVLVYPPWRAELSFVTFIILLIALTTGAYLLARLAITTLNLPATIRARQQRKQNERQNTNFTEALAAYLEGRYLEAEKTASTIEGDKRREQLARIIALRSAHESRAYARRDSLLAKIREEEEPSLSALIAEAEQKVEARDLTGALTAIEAGKSIIPGHTALLRMELKSRQQLGQWDEVLKIADQLTKANALDETTLEHTRRAAHIGNLKRLAGDKANLLAYWKRLSKAQKASPGIALEAANSFALSGDPDTATAAIENSLDENWEESLAARYGQIISSNPLKQIEQAEKWLLKQPRDGALLMSLADLCAHEKLWGKAKSYAEASLSVASNIDAHLALAAFKEQGGQPTEACTHLKQALAICQGKD